MEDRLNDTAGSIIQKWGAIDARFGEFHTDIRFVDVCALMRVGRYKLGKPPMQHSLSDPDYGWLQRHLLRMKWKNRGVKLRGSYA